MCSFQYVHLDQPILLKTVESGIAQRITAPFEDERVEISQSGNRITAFVKNINVRITMDWYNDFMNYEVCLPKALCQISFGHVGNCDGNGDNDRPLIDPRKNLFAICTPIILY